MGVELIPKTPDKDEAGNVIGYLGAASMDELLRCIERNGQTDGIMETAWALPLWQFRKVEEAWRVASKPGVRKGLSEEGGGNRPFPRLARRAGPSSNSRLTYQLPIWPTQAQSRNWPKVAAANLRAEYEVAHTGAVPSA